jgi:hypothetical protein
VAILVLSNEPNTGPIGGLTNSYRPGLRQHNERHYSYPAERIDAFLGRNSI